MHTSHSLARILALPLRGLPDLGQVTSRLSAHTGKTGQ